MPDWKDVQSLLVRMPMVFEASPDPLALFSFDQHPQFANRAFLKLFGVANVDALRQADVTVSIGLRDLLASDVFASVTADADPDRMEADTLRGTIHPLGQSTSLLVSVQCRPASIDGTVIGVFMQVRDLGLQHRYEASDQYLQILFNGSPQAIASIDLNGCYLAVNPAFERLYGYTALELAGEHVSKVFPGHRNPIDTILIEIRRGNTARYEATALRKNGKAIRVAGLVLPQVIDGRTVGLYQFARHVAIRSDAVARDAARAADVRRGLTAIGPDDQTRFAPPNGS